MNKNRKIIAIKRNNNTSNQTLCNINKQNIEELNTKNNYQLEIKEKFKKLESKRNETFKELNPYVSENPNLLEYDSFLYHGIRFQNHLEKLEQIFMDNAILAGNYQKDYYGYSDNCNEGEYISLLGFNDYRDLSYRTFIMPNISLVISPECNAIQTIYLPFKEWEVISKQNPQNRYSYTRGEYQVKQKISINLIRAIGIPARYLRLTCREHLIEIYKNDILDLMYKYNVELPIVDTSNYNRPIFIPENYHSHYIKQRTISRIY